MIMLKVVLCLVFVAYAASATLKWHQTDATYTFDAYLQHHGKRYTDVNEHKMRKQIFDANLRHVIAHNQDPTKTWKEEMNHMADWTDEEYANIRGYAKGLSYARKAHQQARSTLPSTSTLLKDLPTSVDWRTQGVVTPVKDQGHCGSCWSFAAAETLESHWALKNSGQLLELSEQQILDCTLNPHNCGGTGGCGGGTVEVAYDTLIKVGGLQEEWTYPYTSYNGGNQTCALPSSNKIFATLSSYTILPSNVYAPVLNAIGTLGPMAISVDANSWRLYATGVFNGCNQTNPDLDHAVQMVGYGTENGSDYWLVRNSWSPTWGEGGYIKIFRTDNVQCGTDSTPSDGSGCDGGPASITVCGTCGILYDVVYPVI